MEIAAALLLLLVTVVAGGCANGCQHTSLNPGAFSLGRLHSIIERMDGIDCGRRSRLTLPLAMIKVGAGGCGGFCGGVKAEPSIIPSFCEPVEMGNNNTWVRMEQNMGPGCWSSFSKEGREVHVLQLRPAFSGSQPALWMTSLEASQDTDSAVPRKEVVVNIVPSACQKAVPEALSGVNEGRAGKRGRVGQGLHLGGQKEGNPLGPKLGELVTSKCKVLGQTALSLEAEDLLTWTVQTHGGVTSFTTLTDMETVTFTGRPAPQGDSVECTLKSSFFPEDYILESVSPTSMRFCSQNPPPDMKELHVINIREGVMIQNVSIQVVSEGSPILFLRGPEGFTWTIESSPVNVGIRSNNRVRMHGFLVPPMTNHTLSDNAHTLQQEVLLQMKTGIFITSYTEISRGGPSLRLVIGSKGKQISEKPQSTATPSAPNPEPHPLRLQLVDSSDLTTPLSSSARTIYANISIQTLAPFLTPKVDSCQLHSQSSCPVTRPLDLPIRTEHCFSSSCVISFSLPVIHSQAQNMPSTSWVLNCSVDFCAEIQGKQLTCTKGGNAVENVGVLRSSPPHPTLPPRPPVPSISRGGNSHIWGVFARSHRGRGWGPGGQRRGVLFRKACYLTSRPQSAVMRLWGLVGEELEWGQPKQARAHLGEGFGVLGRYTEAQSQRASGQLPPIKPWQQLLADLKATLAKAAGVGQVLLEPGRAFLSQSCRVQLQAGEFDAHVLSASAYPCPLTLVPVRTAVPAPALAAPRAHPPVAWPRGRNQCGHTQSNVTPIFTSFLLLFFSVGGTFGCFSIKCTASHTHMHTHTHRHTRTKILTCTYTHTLTHTYIRKHACTPTHIYTKICPIKPVRT
ncbi:hypothetical protein JZ751_001240 [Albula glossodonta]|uniref:TGFBR3/Endoglin-like N-terminal domain-containing protein n=1 Tax=Albula glossodonta TaxID=121402 RepID=A0A8T2PT54_9TELE|nr:hypothetical protein JZ751_001240 [Albula glossodonta]